LRAVAVSVGLSVYDLGGTLSPLCAACGRSVCFALFFPVIKAAAGTAGRVMDAGGRVCLFAFVCEIGGRCDISSC
jgi:hypothetical protein